MNQLAESITDEVKPYRRPNNEVDPIFVNRWSPRAFSPEPIDDSTLWSVFEAARWAPSSANEQPWRFVIARTEADRARFVSFLMEGNQVWARHAPVLIVVAAKTTYTGIAAPYRVHAFDAGCAWGYLALAALQHGLITHGMAGFDPDKAREVLGVPDDFAILAVIALGHRGDKSTLPEPLQQRELPSDRRPVSESVMEGGFRPPVEAEAETKDAPGSR